METEIRSCGYSESPELCSHTKWGERPVVLGLDPGNAQGGVNQGRCSQELWGRLWHLKVKTRGTKRPLSPGYAAIAPCCLVSCKKRGLVRAPQHIPKSSRDTY